MFEAYGFECCDAPLGAGAKGERARIVNLASIAGIRHKISGAYAASKAAVIALTKVMAVEWLR